MAATILNIVFTIFQYSIKGEKKEELINQWEETYEPIIKGKSIYSSRHAFLRIKSLA